MNTTPWVHPQDLSPSQRPCFLISSYHVSGFQHINFGGTQIFRSQQSCIYVLKVETMGFANRLDLQLEKRGVKDNSRYSVWATERKKLSHKTFLLPSMQYFLLVFLLLQCTFFLVVGEKAGYCARPASVYCRSLRYTVWWLNRCNIMKKKKIKVQFWIECVNYHKSEEERGNMSQEHL